MNKHHARFWLAMLELSMSYELAAGLINLLTFRWRTTSWEHDVSILFTPADRRKCCAISCDEQHRNGCLIEL
jgi:hypothetical protein